jgi:hypothetical protein
MPLTEKRTCRGAMRTVNGSLGALRYSQSWDVPRRSAVLENCMLTNDYVSFGILLPHFLGHGVLPLRGSCYVAMSPKRSYVYAV